MDFALFRSAIVWLQKKDMFIKLYYNVSNFILLYNLYLKIESLLKLSQASRDLIIKCLMLLENYTKHLGRFGYQCR